MADYGLLKGIGEGISAGLDTYMAMKKMKHDQRLSEMTHGIRENPDTGEMEYTPQALLKQQTELQDKKQQKEMEFLKAQIDGKAKGLIVTRKEDGSFEVQKDPGFVDQEKLYRGMQMQKLSQELSQGPKYTEGQSGAATFAQRVMDANDQIQGLLGKGYDPSKMMTMAQRTSYAPELIKNEDVKLMEQAERNFINAVLRKESGASISPTEFSSAEKQYFPRPGDTPEVLSQKERNRQVALAGLQSAAGPAMKNIEGLLPKKESKTNGLLNELSGKAQATQTKGLTPEEQSEYEALKKKLGK